MKFYIKAFHDLNIFCPTFNRGPGRQLYTLLTEKLTFNHLDYHLTRRKEPGSLVREEDTDKGIWDNFYHLLGELLCTVDGLELV